MRYFTSDTHFGHPLVTALRGFLNNGRLRTEYRDVWQAQGRAAAHAWIKQYVRDNQTSFKAICDITRHENTIIGNINETVGRDDELWILGDLSYRCTVEHTLDCLRRINCRHLHLIIGNHDRNFRLRSNDALYEDVFETIDDYREIDMELPVLDGSGKPTAATARQTIGNINETIGRDDELWILGDLSYRCTVEHTLDCLRRINCRHLHLIIGNHDRNFRLRSNDALYEDVFETIDDYREIDMELPVLDGSGKPTAATARQTIGMSHFPRLSALAEEHGNWPENWNKFADVAPTTEGWLLYGHTHQGIPDGTDPLSVNVGLDAWDLEPVSEQQLLAWFTFRHADQSK